MEGPHVSTDWWLRPTHADRAPPTPKRSMLPVVAAAAVAAVAGIVVGYVASTAATTTSSTPAPTVTVTRTAEAAQPKPKPSPAAKASTFTAGPSDFQVSLKVLKRECFGDQGCNYTYRIQPQYVGAVPLPDTGTVEVSYQVLGDEGGPIDNTFTVENGTASYDKTESASTNRNSVKLKVKVTDVSYTP
jgi:hypothetical protein